MQLHLLGHVHLTRQGQPVPVSTKAAALLTYLCLEGVAHHREHLAELLWDTPDPLRNLRVELARLKRDGVVNFPDRQPMLNFQARLDLTDWLASADQVADAAPSTGFSTGLNAWLATLRGLPLSGLEDLGSRTFQQWLESQRWSISEQLERTLELVQARLLHGRHPEAAGHIQARADRLGLNLPVPVLSAQPPLPGSALAAPAPTSPAPVPSAWPAGTDLPARSAPDPEWRCLWDEHLQLTRLMHQARTQPQLVLLSGRPGSGKRSLIRQSVEGSGWQAIYLQASVGRPLFLEALSQHLNALVQQPVPQRVSGVRPARPGSDDSLIELASTLHRSELSLVIAVQNAALGQVWLPELVRFLLDLPLSLILVLSESGQVRMEALRQDLAFLEPQRVHQFQMPPLSPRMLLQAWQLQAQQREQRQTGPDLAAPPTGTLPLTTPPPLPTPLQRLEGDEALTRATRLIQRSEGWPLHAQALYRQPGQDDLPDIVRATLLSEVAQLNPELRQALASLSVVNAPIGPEIVTLLLGEAAPELLLQAVRQRLLTPAASREDLALPVSPQRRPDPGPAVWQ